MTWFKVDDKFHSHPKTLMAGNAAVGLFVRLGSWSGEHGTNGVIPKAVALSFGGKREVQSLVSAGLLDPTDDGWVIHDFLDYNPSAEKVADVRSKRAAAGAQGGKQKASKLLANAIAESCPDPEPVPIVLQTDDDSESVAPESGPSSSFRHEIAMHAARLLYARRGHNVIVNHPRRWIEATAAGMLAERADRFDHAMDEGWTLDTAAEWVLSDPVFPPAVPQPSLNDPECPDCAGSGYKTIDHEANIVGPCDCRKPPLRLIPGEGM